MSWPGVGGFRIFYSDEPNPDEMARWERIEIGGGHMASVSLMLTCYFILHAVLILRSSSTEAEAVSQISRFRIRAVSCNQ